MPPHAVYHSKYRAWLFLFTGALSMHSCSGALHFLAPVDLHKQQAFGRPELGYPLSKINIVFPFLPQS
jgi:hypothetical protein